MTRCVQIFNWQRMFNSFYHSGPQNLQVPYLCAALSVWVALQDVSHHGGVTFLHCPVEGSLSILMWREKKSKWRLFMKNEIKPRT